MSNGLVLLAAVCLMPVLAAPAVAGQDTPVATVLEAERALARAMHGRDAAALDALLDPAFVLRGSPDVGRDEWIANALTRCWGDRFDLSNLDGRAAGDAIVASFEHAFYVDPITCEPARLASLVTDVWVEREGRWRLLVRHAGTTGRGLERQFARELEPPPLLEASGELSFVATAGNTDTSTLGAAASLAWRPGRHTTHVVMGFVRSEAGDVERARALWLEARQSWSASERIEAFGDARVRRDRFAGIDGRLALDAGLAYRVLNERQHSLRADLSAGVVRENRVAGNDLTFGSANAGLAWRWARGSVELSERAQLTSSLATRGAWRAASAAGLSVVLTRVLSLKLAHTLDYVRQPVPGFRRTDSVLSTSLVVTIRRRQPIAQP
jgi:putative salt-induced outer membrane protein YdiY